MFRKNLFFTFLLLGLISNITASDKCKRKLDETNYTKYTDKTTAVIDSDNDNFLDNYEIPSNYLLELKKHQKNAPTLNNPINTKITSTTSSTLRPTVAVPVAIANDYSRIPSFIQYDKPEITILDGYTITNTGEYAYKCMYCINNNENKKNSKNNIINNTLVYISSHILNKHGETKCWDERHTHSHRHEVLVCNRITLKEANDQIKASFSAQCNRCTENHGPTLHRQTLCDWIRKNHKNCSQKTITNQAITVQKNGTESNKN